jgi:hypothetical protein
MAPRKIMTNYEKDLEIVDRGEVIADNQEWKREKKETIF